MCEGEGIEVDDGRGRASVNAFGEGKRVRRWDTGPGM
jgi:hypothetical protein